MVTRDRGIYGDRGYGGGADLPKGDRPFFPDVIFVEFLFWVFFTRVKGGYLSELVGGPWV